jgi:hypothetical protein
MVTCTRKGKTKTMLATRDTRAPYEPTTYATQVDMFGGQGRRPTSPYTHGAPRDQAGIHRLTPGPRTLDGNMDPPPREHANSLGATALGEVNPNDPRRLRAP